MFTHTITKLFSSDSGVSFSSAIASTGGLEINVDEAIPALSSDLAVAFTADVSQLKSLYIVGSAAMTIETNDGGSPINTITLAANVPFVWTSQDSLDLRDTAETAITTDITALYLTSTGGGSLKIRALIDPTV